MWKARRYRLKKNGREEGSEIKGTKRANDAFMQAQLQWMAKMRDEAVEREKKLQEKWESKVRGEVKIRKKRKKNPGKGSGKERVEGPSSKEEKDER